MSSLFQKRKLDEQLSEEIRLHVELATEAHMAKGMTPEEARYAALCEFGNVTNIEEQAREGRGWVWLEQIGQDLRYAVRMLVKTPGVTLTAVSTLALGLGVNSALFTVYNTIALRSLPVKEPEMLVKVSGQGANQGGFYPHYSYPEYVDYRDGNQTLSDLAAVWPSFVSVDDGNAAEPDPMFDAGGSGTVLLQNVSTNYFQALGAGITRGRGFMPEENRAPGDGAVIVLSHLFWSTRMHGNPGVLGQTIKLRNQSYTVIGVAEEGFSGDQPAPPLGWVPFMNVLRNRDLTNWNFTPLRLVGRLRPGVTEQEAKLDLNQVAARLAKEHAFEGGKDAVKLERGMRFMTIPMNAKTLSAVTPVLFGFALVLLIACTNVANLLLARGITRQQEIAVRLTLGATRARVLRQLLTENLLLCVLGAVAGLVLSYWTLQALKPAVLGFLPPDWAFETRRWTFLRFTPDHRVAIFTAVLALVAAVGSGLMPALQASRANLISSLNHDARGLGRNLSPARLRNFLVVAQVAVCLMLLSCAGLLVRNMISLRHPDLGFDPSAVFQVSMRAKGVPPAGKRNAYEVRRQSVAQLNTLPDVVAATAAVGGPMLGGPLTNVTLQGYSDIPSSTARYGFVLDGFVGTFGLHLLQGRSFTADEVRADRRLVVISESAAKQFWPGQESIGRRISLNEHLFTTGASAQSPDASREFEVVGVVSDARSTLIDEAKVFLYVPLAPGIATGGGIYVRPRGDSAAMLAEIVRQADVAGGQLRFERRVSANIDEQRLPFLGLSVLSAMLAGLALLMAAVGLYGVMSFTVNQRVREIGIRAALGATAADIISLVVRQGVRLVALGVAVGLLGGLGFTMVLRRVLFGAGRAIDPVTFGAVTLVFAVVALLACWVPAWRAARVDPATALRAE